MAGRDRLYVISTQILIKRTFPGYEWPARIFLLHRTLVETKKAMMHWYQPCHLSLQPHNSYPETVFEYGQYLENLELYITYISNHERSQVLNPYYVPNTFEMCQAAIDKASHLNRKEDLNAASVLLTITGHSLWEAQRKQFPEPVDIQDYNQWTTIENDSIGFW